MDLYDKAFEICCFESQKLKFSNFLAFNREVADFIYCCSIFPINAKEKKKMILVEQSLSAQLGFFLEGKTLKLTDCILLLLGLSY